MTETQKCLIYLLRCAVSGNVPDSEIVSRVDMNELCELAAFHKVGAAVAVALERAGIINDELHIVYKKSVRRNILLDVERAALFSDLDARGIWHMPLKGALLKELYPENGMREMSDNDILFDPERRAEMKEIMLAHGFECAKFGFTNHDIYTKPPALSFELHVSLFSERNETLYLHYSDIRRIMIKESGSEYAFRLSDNDFYVYMTAHEWKHFHKSGTGVRSLLDCFVFLREKGGELDREYISRELRALGIERYERQRTALALKLFSPDGSTELTKSEAELFEYYITSGAYGIVENNIEKQLSERSKLSFVMRSLFPTLDYMRESVSFVDKRPYLYPAGVLWRWGRILTRYRKYLARVVKAVSAHGKNK